MTTLQTSLLIAVIVTVVLISDICHGGVVYVKYSRRVPSKFSGDEFVEEVVEEFDMARMPPYYGSTDTEVEAILKSSIPIQPTSNGAQPVWYPPEPNVPIAKPVQTLPSWPSFNAATTSPRPITTTEQPIFNWFGERTPATTNTTEAPFFYTTKPFENENPDYSDLIPTITAEIIPPSATIATVPPTLETTTEINSDIEYYDNGDDENDNEKEETTTGPTKLAFPSFENIDSEVENKGAPSFGGDDVETTTESYVEEDEENENYDENYEYESGDKENENGVEADTTTTARAEVTTKKNLFSFFS